MFRLRGEISLAVPCPDGCISQSIVELRIESGRCNDIIRKTGANNGMCKSIPSTASVSQIARNFVRSIHTQR